MLMKKSGTTVLPPSENPSDMISKPPFTRWFVVASFAVAMAWMESAVVLYLRTLIGRLDPYQPNPLPVVGGLAGAEVIREAATLIMLALVGWLAGRTWRSRLGFFLLAFGVWDIGYYVFLVPLTGWPNSVFDWDILFLIPLPWWGPVLAPVLIAVLMVIGGTLLAVLDEPGRPLWPARGTIWGNLGGVILALYVFMADAVAAVIRGEPPLRELLPTHFNWPIFLCAVALMALPVMDLGRRAWRLYRSAEASTPQTPPQPSP